MGIECRLDDSRTRELLAALNHHETALRVTAERAMNTRLEGGCQVPIGRYAELIDGEIWLRALVVAPDGSLIIRGERRGAEVTFCECYQRCAIHYDGAEEAMRWQSREVTTVVVTSGEMLQQLWSLIPQWYREHWLLHCRLLVVSERLAKLARELGWQDIKVADNADNDALLRALQ